MIPFFCQAKAIQREASEPVGIGARQIPTLGAGIYFDAGDRIFISEADATEVEYLGSVVSVAADAITVELATAKAHGAAAKLWTPLDVFEWPAGLPEAARTMYHSGVEVVRSLGGVAYSTRLASPYEVESVRFENLTDERAAQLLTWIDQQADGGLLEFSYVDGARVVWRARLDAPTVEFSRNSRDLLVAAFNLHLLSEASYV